MKHILLIEDDHYLRDLYQAIIIGAGYKVNIAADAQSALDILDEYGADLIVLDIFLPFHNGIELLQELQSYKDWQNIPVIVVSTQAQADFKANESIWREHGVRTYLSKSSLSPGELLKKINDLLYETV